MGKFDYEFTNNRKSEVEKFVGIEIYSTPELVGTGGKYKDDPKDFIVKEITKEGKILEIKEDYQSSPFLDGKDYFTTFNLVKINKVTFDAINQVARGLRIPTSIISYSGLKDKTSISVQKASIRGNYVNKLKSLNLKDIFIRSITPTKKPVTLGSNRGNHFEITIRNIHPRENLKQDIEELISKLKKDGFPNYYGLQRFGKYRPNSHIVGKHILNENFKEAFNEFVCNIYSLESKSVSKHRRRIKKTLNEGRDLEKAFVNFPRGLNYEYNLINYLINHPEDYEGAIRSLSDDLISLLINSFQSFLFNKMLSLRVKSGYPLNQPIKGDVISILDEVRGRLTDIKYVYNDLYMDHLDYVLNMNRGSLVIPLVGYKTNVDDFPLMSRFFKEIIKEENISMNIFDSPLLNEYELKGAVRPMLVKPIGLRINDFEEDDRYTGKKKLKVEFSLPGGCYATMLLRELMKETH
ncbi:MAG: tRNA pseudouridine(13) synthase TruD [Promethearchaeota archaeon]|nr:MAG: tRNA pseudouridine(13) synthase TruD [Candidatus Lokiarchaeota archaeon]